MPNWMNQFNEDARAWGMKAIDVQNNMAQLAVQKEHMDIMNGQLAVSAAKMIDTDLSRVYSAPTPKARKIAIELAVKNAISARKPYSQNFIAMLESPDWDTQINQGLAIFQNAGLTPEAAKGLLFVTGADNAPQIIQTQLAKANEGQTLKDIYGTSGGKQIVENAQSAIKQAAAAGDTQSVSILNQGLQNPSMAMQVPEFNQALVKYGTQGLAQQNRQERVEIAQKESATPVNKLLESAESVGVVSQIPWAKDVYQRVKDQAQADPTQVKPDDVTRLGLAVSQANGLQKLQEKNSKAFDQVMKLKDNVDKKMEKYRPVIDGLEAGKSLAKVRGGIPLKDRAAIVQKLTEGVNSIIREGEFAQSIPQLGKWDQFKRDFDLWTTGGELSPDQLKAFNDWIKIVEARTNARLKDTFNPDYRAALKLSSQTQDKGVPELVFEPTAFKAVTGRVPTKASVTGGDIVGKPNTKVNAGSAKQSLKPLTQQQKQAIQSGRITKEQAASAGYDVSGL